MIEDKETIRTTMSSRCIVWASILLFLAAVWAAVIWGVAKLVTLVLG